MRIAPSSDAMLTVLPLCRAAPTGKGVISGHLRRCFDPDTVNTVVNHPDVRPFVGIGGPDGYLDHSAPILRPENWFLLGEHGGFALTFSAPGVHEVHTFILKSGRGAWAMQAAQEMIAYARDHGDCMLWTRIHPSQAHVATFAVRNGMTPAGMVLETFGQPYDVYKMEIN